MSRYEDVAALFSGRNDPPRGIPVLDEPLKSSGEYNYNFEPLITIDEQYARDAFAVIGRYPANYIIGVLIANRLFFSPSSMNEYFSPANRAAVKAVEQVFNPLFYGAAAEPAYIAQPHFGFDQPPSLEVNTSRRLIAAWALVLVLGGWRVRRALSGRATEDRTASVVLGYLLFSMLYVRSARWPSSARTIVTDSSWSRSSSSPRLPWRWKPPGRCGLVSWRGTARPAIGRRSRLR